MSGVRILKATPTVSLSIQLYLDPNNMGDSQATFYQHVPKIPQSNHTSSPLKTDLLQ